MALILSSRIVEPTIVPYSQYIEKEKLSRYRLRVPSSYLSEPYFLEDGDMVVGEILDVQDPGGESLKELAGKKIEFYLYKMVKEDYLYITLNDWINYFREYGLVKTFLLSVKLIKAVKKDGTEIPLYTKRDVKI